MKMTDEVVSSSQFLGFTIDRTLDISFICVLYSNLLPIERRRLEVLLISFWIEKYCNSISHFGLWSTGQIHCPNDKCNQCQWYGNTSTWQLFGGRRFGGKHNQSSIFTFLDTRCQSMSMVWWWWCPCRSKTNSVTLFRAGRQHHASEIDTVEPFVIREFVGCFVRPASTRHPCHWWV